MDEDNRDVEAMDFAFACGPWDRRGVRERVRAQLEGINMCLKAGEVGMVLVGDEITS
jgi:hypothetical protein